MSKAANKPTPEHVEKFDSYIKHWQGVLNLHDWRIERGQRREKEAMASIECDGPARLAVYRIGQFGGTAITNESLSLTALHECLHVFLFELIAMAQDRNASPEMLEGVEHRVINVLEKVLGETNAGSNSER